ncbi:hypothetical protein Sgou_20630 [Streptomyces gougerotii]|uniref:Uncharacterized protein n=1 Tax=Streptomyces gougerotii TaxID=53448 RepID=A0ABQ1D4B0_9ACTN|nr:hypothetical protein Sgou_20630 [Streptomyces gougerotii]GGU34724.1 hypothetical protein GCM10015534_41540 [Streptomyces diastaticus subsp. diastaticus]
MATYPPTLVAWSSAYVNKVAEWPVISPSNRFCIVATPAGVPVATARAGARSAGAKPLTVKVPVALMRRA